MHVTFKNRSDGGGGQHAFRLGAPITELYGWAVAHFGASEVVLKTNDFPPRTIPCDGAQHLEAQPWLEGMSHALTAPPAPLPPQTAPIPLAAAAAVPCCCR